MRHQQFKRNLKLTLDNRRSIVRHRHPRVMSMNATTLCGCWRTPLLSTGQSLVATDTSAVLPRCSPETGLSTHFYEQPPARTVAPGGGGSLVAAVPAVLRAEAGREPRGSASRTLRGNPGQRRIPPSTWPFAARPCHFMPVRDTPLWHESGTTGRGRRESAPRRETDPPRHDCRSWAW